MPKPDSLIIRPVANEEELTQVHRLTHDAYVSVGYATPQPDRRLVHYGDFDHLPETTVLVAVVQNEIVGSLSLTLDGPWGLTVEKDFKRVCDSLRYSGRSLGVVWRLAMSKSASPSRHIVMELFHSTFDLALLQGANTCLITVNPKHQTVYQRMLNATVVSTNSFTKGLDQAPGVLLRLDAESAPPNWKRLNPICENSHAA
jgi:hypothetical protein